MGESDSDTSAPFILEFDSRGTAEVVQGMLRSAGVEASITVTASVAAVPVKVQLSVGAEMAHRARWLLRESEFSDKELTYLATGELDAEE